MSWQGQCYPELSSIPLKRSPQSRKKLIRLAAPEIGQACDVVSVTREIAIKPTLRLEDSVIGAAPLSGRSPFFLLHYVFAKRLIDTSLIAGFRCCALSEPFDQVGINP